ncbi:MAG: ATP synthase subunit alpha [candidate division CPR2 bacterium GW2011_GWC1_39_9]|uniref:ATP synthase subunit alpha n=1 Tax=candidate division CPR2 bacterium GW2011_GWC2_39_10 TaxID=1618345 RepID=A0A0G0LRW8_UNCC2|nr:MAG: ATP synthase subunit alpha [candidate division CPR2 bacterium GW2011_GWC2_39_10]KKR36127.1 MAG: ATP synthase subunit alpha [candidate division CPR2 bacterium GW2011_GWC1_39_9]
MSKSIVDFLNEIDEKPKDKAAPKKKKKTVAAFKPSLNSPKTVKNISKVLEESMPVNELSPDIVEVGEVVYIGDGVCKIEGLSNARIDDVLKIETEKGEVLTLVLGMSDSLVETVVLGDYFGIKKGQNVISTRKTLKISSGEDILGRVISPIGKPLDGRGPIKGGKMMQVERPAPPVYMRSPIVDQLKTGFLVVDSIIPVGLGQRELVIGDRKTGKTRFMADVICNLKGAGIYCVYVAIGAQKAKVKGFTEYLDRFGALEYTAIVMSSSDDPPSLNYLAPYAGSALAEYFLDQGKNALVIYDDLSKHAKAYRQMALLLKRSPGRDAYPGDIFFLHSRLLERSAKLSGQYGGGSITALPMAETQNGDISEYITTNLMSITDGHIYLDSLMMHDGILPAVNSGASVSRIGGSIQPPMLRKLAELAAGQLARYNEVKSYEIMNTEISIETEREIAKGKRILEIFTQKSGINYLQDEEVLLLYLVTTGLLDFIDLSVVTNIKSEIIEFYRNNRDNFSDFAKGALSVMKSVDEIKPFADHLIEGFYAKSESESAKTLKNAYLKDVEDKETKEKEKASKEAENKAKEGDKT